MKNAYFCGIIFCEEVYQMFGLKEYEKDVIFFKRIKIKKWKRMLCFQFYNKMQIISVQN